MECPLLTCRELASFLLEYVSGELPSDTRRSFEEHLAVCPNCVRYLEQYRATIEVSRSAIEVPESTVADCPEELVKAILALRARAAGAQHG